MDPRDLQNLLIPEIKEGILIVASGYPISEVGQALEDLSEHLQSLGISYLLAQADVTEFRNNLIRSGHARRYFLRRSAEENNEIDRHLALSRTDSFFDSLAGGDLFLTKEIVDLSPSRWNANWEYEDDFRYRKFLESQFLGTWAGEQDISNRKHALEDFKETLDSPDSDLRFAICTSLVDRNCEEFNAALFEFLEQKKNQFDEKRDTIITTEFPDSLFWIRNSVSIEGLALIRLGNLTGIAVEEHLPLCPELGRLPVESNEISDLFEEVDRERSRFN
jgi:hypothetical protein